ncbi:hypothetical protein PR048_030977 [Dryococelus australis]|uniref:Uncharacterized protein n=1 Tax=Dryococelus australis TaxID=614101 RepID=A0ABQ9G4Q5_9NEOP|nr:hypothetical protein PR048_030977 [Dryococelus australis]
MLSVFCDVVQVWVEISCRVWGLGEDILLSLGCDVMQILGGDIMLSVGCAVMQIWVEISCLGGDIVLSVGFGCDSSGTACDVDWSTAPQPRHLPYVFSLMLLAHLLPCTAAMQLVGQYITSDNHLMARDVYPASSPIHAPLRFRLTRLSMKVMEEQLVNCMKSVVNNVRHNHILFSPQLRNGSENKVPSPPTGTTVVLQSDAELPNWKRLYCIMRSPALTTIFPTSQQPSDSCVVVNSVSGVWVSLSSIKTSSPALKSRLEQRRLDKVSMFQRSFQRSQPVWSSTGKKGRGKRNIPEKTHRPAVSSSMRKYGRDPAGNVTWLILLGGEFPITYMDFTISVVVGEKKNSRVQ